MSIYIPTPAQTAETPRGVNLSRLFNALGEHLSLFSKDNNWSAEILVIADTDRGLKTVFSIYQKEGLTMSAAAGLSEVMVQAPPLDSFFIRGVSKDSANRARALVVADLSLKSPSTEHFSISPQDASAKGEATPFQDFSLQIPDRKSPVFAGESAAEPADIAENSDDAESEEYKAVFGKKTEEYLPPMDLSACIGDAAVPIVEDITDNIKHIEFRYHCLHRVDLVLGGDRENKGMRLFLIPPVY
jgi:hypothetical protein